MKGALRDIGVSSCMGLLTFWYFAKDESDWNDATSLTSFSKEFWLCIFFLSWPYFMFSLIWNSPSTWIRLTSTFPLSWSGRDSDEGKRAVSAFSKMNLLLKLTQAYGVGQWWISSSNGDVNGAQDMLGYLKENVSVQRLVVAAILMIAGQVLNAAIYYRIGDDGVYYGFKLGRTVPWCTKFPFNVGFRHPQYFGVVLNIWAIAIVLLSPFSLREGLLQISLAWCFMYFLVSCMEETGGESDDSDDALKKKK